ncbi:hypothetical protein [Nocardioides sp.]|uniref:SCO4848 family membrane protein n=1 Tax=Nocardioides sp. TaxID=35761 RepID=UPI003219368D
MKLERKHAVLLLGVALWNVVTFSTFAKNLYSAYERGEDRAAGYWIAHTVLIVVNFAIAGALGRLGWKAYRQR